MDAVGRTGIIWILMFFSTWSGGQYMNWSRLAEDTIYYAREYHPDWLMHTHPGPAQMWNFRSLRAPYAISRSIMVNGSAGRNNGTQAQLMNGSQVDAILMLNGNSAVITQVLEENPVCPGGRLVFDLMPHYKPFYRGVMGDQTSYKGKMVSTFAWPRNVSCGWTPPMIPDSCRITYTINEDIEVDGEGTLYMPTEITQAHRQRVTRRRAVKIETRTGLLWRDVTALVPKIHLISVKEYYRFVSADQGLTLAEVEVDDNDQPVCIEFKTHPIATRILGDEPNKPDIYAFPNPSFDIVRFQLSDLNFGQYKLRILNILGTVVKEVDVFVDNKRKTITVDLGDLQRGTYLYRLQDSLGRTVKTKRVVLIQA